MKALSIAAALLLATVASAQYKVVGPDGRVTYTDRPDTTAGSKVTQIRRDGAARADAAASMPAALPFELRQVAERFPVTLYAAPDCGPCDRGRKLLQQRGVPFTERLVQTEDDQAALEQLAGARTVPLLAVGAQLSRGWLETEWQTNLDLAGYPAQSRLPRDWQAAAPRPLVPRAEVPPPAPPVRVAPAPVTAPEPPEAPGLRF
jgi:glutaredoxin